MMRAAAAAALREDPPSADGLLALLGAAGKGVTDPADLANKLRDRGKLRKLQREVAHDRADQAGMAALIGQPAPDDLDADWLASHARALRDKEQAFASTLSPVVGLLKGLLESDRALGPEIERLVRDSIEVLEAYAPLYRSLGDWLLKLAEERRAGSSRARPSRDTIDYARLSREHIARYPKIRARLAK